VTILFTGSGHIKQWTIYRPERISIYRTGGLANTYQKFEKRVINTKNPIKDDEISDETPLGRAILGKHVGDVVPYEAPDGVHTIKILEVIQDKEL
jgi:transcription elongation GreA/GreB family factor